MTLDSFATTLVVAAIRHDWMQDEITAAGIKLDELPPKLICQPTWVCYQNKLKTMSPASAAHELDADLQLLERFAEPISAIPKSAEVLREKYQRLFDAYQFGILADELRSKPEQGKELIRQFQLEEAKAVQSQTLAELSLLVDHHLIEAKQHRSVRQIKGFEHLSNMIGGFNPERLGIFLGGTGFGKTNFAVNLSLAAAKTMRVAYVNMEMGYPDMVKRFSVIGAGVSYKDYALGQFEADRVTSVLESVGANINLTSGRALTFEQIACWVRLLNSKEQLGLVVIDYDQKVDLNLKYQLEEWKALQKVMEAFEDLAKELQLYVLILAQVNREGLISGSHRAQFPAHTVLAFYEHETFGPLIEAKKNRHGKKMQALTVLYNENNSVITESMVITLQPKGKEERQKLKPKESDKPKWWSGT